MTGRDQKIADREFMRRCFQLALRGAGRVSPNPLVGALLVRSGRIVAEGWHRRYGLPHAEVDCLRHVGGSARGMTMYVNLEPCSHFGLTPPCADALIRAGVKRLVVAMRDPNPRVRGKGLRRLRAAGVEVTEGILEDEARFLNRFFRTHIVARRPYVHLKAAESLDGRITGGGARWISSVPSRRQVHRWRATHDAVVIGAGTVLADRPSLTVRLARGRHPHVVVLDGRLRLDPDDLRSAGQGGRRVILCTSTHAVRERIARARKLARAGIEVWAFPSRRSEVPLPLLLRELHAADIGSILVEGGAEVFAQFVRGGLVDECSLFLAPRLHGRGLGAFEPLRAVARRSGSPAGGKEIAMQTLRVYNSGGDVLIRAFRERYRFTDLAQDT